MVLECAKRYIGCKTWSELCLTFEIREQLGVFNLRKLSWQWLVSRYHVNQDGDDKEGLAPGFFVVGIGHGKGVIQRRGSINHFSLREQD